MERWAAKFISGTKLGTCQVISAIINCLSAKLSLFITNGISCVMAIRGQYAGANDFGWSTVALYSSLALVFGAFMLKKPRLRYPI
jgi:hypothetical protein